MRYIRKWYEREQHLKNFSKEGRTVQAHKDECDINKIMSRWKKTGMIDHVNSKQASFEDLTVLPERYQDAMNYVLEAQNMFMELPANVRREFDNDPGKLLEALEDPQQVETLQGLGILQKPAEALLEPLPGTPEPDQTVPQTGAETNT